MEDILRLYSGRMVFLLVFSGSLLFSSTGYAYMEDDLSMPSDSMPMNDTTVYNDGSFYSDEEVKVHRSHHDKKNHAKKKHQGHMGGKNNYLVFNPRTHTLTAHDGSGSVVRSFKASGGRNYCPDTHRRCHTPTGTFHVLSERGADCRSSRYPIGKGGSPMPYCMFFTQFYAIHGSYEVPNYNASHGCIRVHPPAAKWLMNHFVDIGTTVKVLPY